MNKKKFFYLLLIILFIISSIFLFTKISGLFVQRRNVVMIVSDALRADVLGCYGGEAQTPNIDWLAENGVLFKNAYSTSPVTMPSAVSMLTGNYSRAYGVVKKKKIKGFPQTYFFYVNNKETLLPEILKDTGYHTFMDVENPLAFRSNNMQGFKKFRHPRGMSNKEKNFVLKTIGIPKLTGIYSRLYDFLYYLLTVPGDENFFLLKWFFDPHAPYRPPEKFRDKIKFDVEKLPHKKRYYLYIGSKKMGKVSDDERLYLKELYKAEVEALDERVGFVIKALKHRKLLDKTIIVFTSDHGELFGEHGRMGHALSYLQPLVNVPLIMTGPGLPKNKAVETVVSHLDLMPTLSDLLGVKLKGAVKGKSFTALFRDDNKKDRWPYFDRMTNPLPPKMKFKKRNCDALIFNWFKIITYNWKGKNYHKLYNLKDDPLEMKNLSAEKKDIVDRLYKEILKIRRDNDFRFRKNMDKLDKSIDIDSEWEKTREKLKSLGYLN